MGKHADTTPRVIVASYLPGTGKRKAAPVADNKLSTHTSTSEGYFPVRPNINN